MKSKSLSRRDLIKTGAAVVSTVALSTGLDNRVIGQTNKVKPDYSLQKGIRNLNVPKTLSVVGAGRLGSWVALFAAVSGVENFVLVDPGVVDAKDLATTPFTPSQVGKDKVEATRELIMSVRPDAQVSTHKIYLKGDKDASLLEGAIINGASDQNLRRVLPGLAKRSSAKYAAGGYLGTKVAVTDRFPKSYGIAEGEPPVWGGGAALSAILTLHSVFVKPINFVGEISSIGVKDADIDKIFRAYSDQP